MIMADHQKKMQYKEIAQNQKTVKPLINIHLLPVYSIDFDQTPTENIMQ